MKGRCEGSGIDVGGDRRALGRWWGMAVEGKSLGLEKSWCGEDAV